MKEVYVLEADSLDEQFPPRIFESMCSLDLYLDRLMKTERGPSLIGSLFITFTYMFDLNDVNVIDDKIQDLSSIPAKSYYSMKINLENKYAHS